MMTFAFFLGGQDLEMQAIRELVRAQPDTILHDHGLAWGARASAYRAELQDELAAGRTPVLVELDDDLPADLPRSALIVVDHHNERAGRAVPTALEQVFQLLKLPSHAWTRELALIAANDRGHVAAMRALDPPATVEEMQRIRAADRAAQGINPTDEAQGAAAIAECGQTLWDGALLVVPLPHARTATVTDRLAAELGGPGYQNLLLPCPRAAYFFGEGRAVAALRQRWPDSFCGGELPERGFWGRPVQTPTDELLSVLEPLLPAGDAS